MRTLFPSLFRLDRLAIRRGMSRAFHRGSLPDGDCRFVARLPREGKAVRAGWPAVTVLVSGLLMAQAADGPALTIDVGHPGARVSPTMWGVFFEDINSGADGGLYAELVKNRSFEFPEPLMGWRAGGPLLGAAAFSVAEDRPLASANPHYLRVTLEAGHASATLTNEGFAGMGVRQGETYRFSMFARATRTSPKAVAVSLIGADGRSLGRTRVGGFKTDWARHEATIRSAATDPKARLTLSFDGVGSLDLDMISLSPTKTWKNRPGGLRADMVQMLADLKPGFVRFPGGCIVEGRYLDTRYQWKTTIGPVAQRKLIINRWNDEFKHRPAPDYFQTFGLGFFEYFQMCEDIGAQPLPILNCGMACQFNSNELVPMDQLDPYIQDALDLIEFANGPATSTWGARRAAMGHPKPFGLRLLGVGNEQWGPQYIERYAAFAKALKTRHPEVQLVASAGPSPDDERFQFLWPKLRELKADFVDEHCYAPPAWFLDHSARYDHYDRSGPKVFMGEYAAQSVRTVSPDNRNNWECALAEAAYLTGLERNGDVVRLASYAPLFGHEERWQWRPNLIWLDNLRIYGTPNYYVQQAFSRNRGDRLLPVRFDGPLPTVNGKPRLYASSVYDEKTREVIVKIVNATIDPQPMDIVLDGATRVKGAAKVMVLTAGDLNDENSLAEPRRVAPKQTQLNVTGPRFSYRAPGASLTVLRIQVG